MTLPVTSAFTTDMGADHKLLGITYEEINVWLFCVAWPLVTLAMVAVIVKLWRENQTLKGQLGIQPVSQG